MNARVVRLSRILAVMAITLMFASSSARASPIPARSCALVDGGFDGYPQSGHPEDSYEGVSAYIYPEPGTLCSYPRNLHYRQVLAWIIIAGGANSHDAWAQVGFIQKSDVSYPEWFSQYNAGGTLTGRYQYDITAQYGVRHTFRVLYVPSYGYLQSTIDTTVWDHSPFNPFAQSSWGDLPFNPQFYDEGNDKNSYVPGTADNPVTYDAVGVQRVSDDVLQSIPCILGAGSSQPNWHHYATSCTRWQLWSTP